MVHSVLAVSSSDKVKRDANRTVDSYANGKKSDSIFSRILDQKVEEIQASPMECHTLTYGQDSKLHTFQYQTREYNY